MNYFTEEQIRNDLHFIKFPMILWESDKFKNLSVQAKVLYAFMKDRLELSLDNSWLDENGNAYIYFTIDAIMDIFQCSEKTALKHKKELLSAELIEEVRQGINKPNRIFVKNIDPNLQVKNCKNYSSGTVKNTGQELENLQGNQTNINQTNINQNNNNGTGKSGNIPYSEIISYLNEKTGKNYKSSSSAHQKEIRARWNEGYTVKHFKMVIENMVSNWTGTDFEQYLRPSTLFGNKFDTYLNMTPKKPNSSIPEWSNANFKDDTTEEDMVELERIQQEILANLEKRS